MLLEHPIFKEPEDPNSPLWKYMDLERFVRLIQSKSLWFSQVNQLEDLLEGSLGRLNWENRGQRIQGFSTPFFGGGKYVGEEDRFYYVNCWHLSDHESMGMWKIYASLGLGIAIKTSPANLKTAILDAKDIYGGIVKYVDHEIELIPKNNGFARYLQKSLPYSYEQEFRLVHSLPNWDEIEETPGGIEIEINPEALITEVVVAPHTEAWRIKIVEQLIESSGYSFKVSKSKIDQPSPWNKKAKS